MVFLGGLLLLILSQVFADLPPQEVSDGECLSAQALWPLRYKGANLLSLLPPGIFYIPMASKATFRMYAEGLLGRPAATQEELDGMQLVLQCGSGFLTINNTGFPNLPNPPYFFQTCLPSGGFPSLPNLGIGDGRIDLDYMRDDCIGLTSTRPDGTISLPPPSVQLSKTSDIALWANDDTTVVLVYRCVGDGTKDFKVISREKTLRTEDIQVVKSKILQAGFKEENIAYATY